MENFESLYELIKGDSQDRNQVWEIYYSNISSICSTLGYRNGIRHNEMITEAYFIFTKACEDYDPYWGSTYNNLYFYPFKNYLCSKIWSTLKGWIQQQQTINNRTQPHEYLPEIPYDAHRDIESQWQVNYLFDFLEPLEQRVIKEYYFYNLLERQIGDKVGLSQSWIHQVKRKALTKLKAIMNLGPLGPLRLQEEWIKADKLYRKEKSNIKFKKRRNRV